MKINSASCIADLHLEIFPFSVAEWLSNLEKLEILKSEVKSDEIDVSKSLLAPGRLLYPKVAKKGKLDELLARRNHWKTVEERALNANKVSIIDGLDAEI